MELVKIIDDNRVGFLTNIDTSISYNEFLESIKKIIGLDMNKRIVNIEFSIVYSENLARFSPKNVIRNRIQSDNDLKTAFKFIDHIKHEHIIFFVNTGRIHRLFIPIFYILFILHILTSLFTKHYCESTLLPFGYFTSGIYFTILITMSIIELYLILSAINSYFDIIPKFEIMWLFIQNRLNF